MRLCLHELRSLQRSRSDLPRENSKVTPLIRLHMPLHASDEDKRKERRTGLCK